MNTNLEENFEIEYWEKQRERIVSYVGKWVGGEDVTCHGHSLMNELLGQVSYMQMLVLSATGKLIEENLAKWLEGNFIGLSYPDSRIWCNQIGALAGNNKASVVAATVAGILAADSRAYGSQTNKLSMLFIQDALLRFEEGEKISEIVSKCRFKNGKPIITGYARPVDRADERLAPHKKMMYSLGFKEEKHLKLAYQIDEYLEDNFGLAMNIGGFGAAFLSDQGFTPEEVYQIKSISVAAGVMASYTDFKSRATGSFLPCHCDDIEYIGPELRSVIDS